MRRLTNRARSEEESVPRDYLQQIHDRHEEWFIEQADLPDMVAGKPVLIVDCTGDLINDKELRSATLIQVLEFAELLSNPAVSGC